MTIGASANLNTIHRLIVLPSVKLLAAPLQYVIARVRVVSTHTLPAQTTETVLIGLTSGQCGLSGTKMDSAGLALYGCLPRL